MNAIYITKLAFFYALGGVLVATLTSGLPFLHVSQWWNQPIVYEKLPGLRPSPTRHAFGCAG